MTSPRQPRGGVVLLATAVCLLVAVSLLVSGLQRTLYRGVHLNAQRQVRQAELLLAAGQDLALASLRADAAYSGQRWEPAVTGRDSAVVNIAIDQEAETFSVAVTYPRESERPVRRSAVFSIPPSLTEAR